MDARKPLSILVSTLIVVSILATPVAAGMVVNGSTNGSTQTFQNTDTFNLTESIDVWDKAPLPLRTTTQPNFSVKNPIVTANYTPSGQGPVDDRKNKFAVYNKDTQVELKFENTSTYDTSKFAGNNTSLVVAHLESDGSQTISDFQTPADLGEARNLLTPQNANANASFKIEKSGEIGTDGELPYNPNFTADQSGAYVVFLATGNAFELDSDDNLTLTGDPTTIVGMDTVLVREGPAQIGTNESVVRSENVSFNVNSPTDISNHTVILYNKNQWNQSYYELVIHEEFSTSMDENDFTLKHSIDTVDGDIIFEGPVTVMGTTFYDKSFTGSTTTPNLLDFVVETANKNTAGEDISEIDTETTSGDTIYASANGVSDGDPLTVSTSKNWSAGEYRWVYLGSGSAQSNFYTETGTIDVSKPEKDTGTSPGGGGGGGGADAPPEEVEDIPASKNANIGGNNPVLRFDDGEFFSNVGFRSQAGLDAMVSVTEVREPPAPGPTGSNFVAGADITFSSGDPGQVDTVQMGIQQTRLRSLGVSPNQLTVYHFDDESDEWEELETTVSYEDNYEVIVEAPSAGFSTYAVFAQQDDDVTTTEPTPTTEQPTTTEPGPTTTTTEAPPTTPPEGNDGLPTWLIVLVILILIGAGVAYYLWGWESAT